MNRFLNIAAITMIGFTTIPVMAEGTSTTYSVKRGISENQFSLRQQLEVLYPGVCWYYNWANTPAKGYENGVIDFTDIEFVPMCWNANYDADKIREYCKSHPATKYILGFNEPNFKRQANMTPQKAAEKWPEIVALAKELNLKIVAPALNYSPDAPYTDPTKWMDEFTALVGKDAYDYVAVHNYGGLDVMKTIATTFHDRYDKDVWVTEFCFWPGESGYVAPQGQISSMISTVEWLEKTPWIYRYAWFKAIGKHDSPEAPNYALIITENGIGERHLSEQGLIYVNMTDFDSTRYWPTETEIAAKDYIESKNISLGKSNAPEPLSPIEISQFNSGAYADWQFDITSDGEYTLVLKVTGEGEPMRYDPTLSVIQIDQDGTESNVAESSVYSLPGNDSDYSFIRIPMNLRAGKCRLRLIDDAEYRPSGLRIASLRLASTASLDGIETSGLQAVYSIDGRLVNSCADPATPTYGLEPGIYIVGGKKIMISK